MTSRWQIVRILLHVGMLALFAWVVTYSACHHTHKPGGVPATETP